MLNSRLRRLAGCVALTAMLLLPAAGVANAGAPACTMTAAPASGPPGTQFVLKGDGYTPTAFRLIQGDTKKIVEVDLGGADPWSYSFVAGDTDVGKWKIVADAGAGCQATAHIHVALPSTSTAGPVVPTDRTPALAAVAGMGVVFLFSARLVFRRSRLPA